MLHVVADPEGDTVRIRLIVAGVGVAALLTACGSTSTESAAGAKSTDRRLAELTAPVVEFTGSDEPVAATGPKTIAWVSFGMATSSSIEKARSFEAAAKELGWTARVIDGRATVDGWNSGVLNALAIHADGIILDSIVPTYVQSALAKADDVGIPVVSLDTNVPPAPGLAKAEIGTSSSDIAIKTAALVAADSGGDAHVLYFTLPESFVPPSDKAWASALKDECASCVIDQVQSVDYVGAAKTMATTVAGALQANPKINYISIPYGELIPYVEQGIAQAGRRGKVKIVDSVCTAPDHKSMTEGGATIGCVSTPHAWKAWQAADTMARVLDGQEVTSDFENNSQIPTRLFVKDNIYHGEFWDGDFDYAAQFKKLWRAS